MWQPQFEMAARGWRVIVPELRGFGSGADATRASNPAVVENLRRQITSNSVEAIAGALQALMTRPDSTPMLPTIRIPTLVVVGDQDAITPPPLSEQMHRDIPGSELVVIQ